MQQPLTEVLTRDFVDIFPQSEVLKVAMLQIETIDNAPEANKAHIEELIAEGIAEGTHLIVLPEMFTTGYTVDTSQAEIAKGPSLKWLLQIAQRTQSIVAGSILVKESGNFYNRLHIAFPCGTRYMSYDKQKLFPPAKEDIYLTAGKEKAIQISIAGWKVKFLICYELRFPELSTLRAEPADALVYIANWPIERIHIWDTLLEARAIENQCFSLGVNRIGHSKKNTTYPGHSAIYNPLGEMLCCVSSGGLEQVLNFNIYKEELRQQKNFLPLQ